MTAPAHRQGMATAEPATAITLRRHCLCGSSAIVGSTPPDAARDIVQAWHDIHTGDGHGQATAQQAADARRRNEEKQA
jgi:hypothetical protein